MILSQSVLSFFNLFGHGTTDEWSYWQDTGQGTVPVGHEYALIAYQTVTDEGTVYKIVYKPCTWPRVIPGWSYIIKSRYPVM